MRTKFIVLAIVTIIALVLIGLLPGGGGIFKLAIFFPLIAPLLALHHDIWEELRHRDDGRPRQH